MKVLTLTPHKPIRYTPGLISLVLLPVCCIVFLHRYNVTARQNCINVALFSPDWNRSLPKQYQLKFPPERSYINVNLTGNPESDKSLLGFARMEIRTMLKTKNTTLGIRFHFGSKAQYWTYVNAIDICYTEKAENWIPYQDDIYVVYPKHRY